LTEDLGVTSLRVQILLYAPDDAKSHYNVELQQRLQGMGHVTNFASRTLVDLGMDVNRIARYVKKHPADAWVVFSGSLDVLHWFSQREVPTFAFAGRRRKVQIASTGPNKLTAISALVHRLSKLGHRRIVMLAREVRRKPHPGEFEQVFLNELAALGMPQGEYNLPDWKESPEGLHHVLDTLFKYTPPTALIIEEPATFIAAQNYLAQRGILAPRDISLICDDPDPAFSWCRPSIAHIGWNSSQCVRRIVRWVNNVAQGKDDRRMSFTKAEFVEGGTIGPVREKRLKSGLK
ncbi:MAG TPA: substrate-binding domain-containing protein, partial [Opitutales bacterium]|nr:substrate-binding domain-containing protein [Opitutales bacterium]